MKLGLSRSRPGQPDLWVAARLFAAEAFQIEAGSLRNLGSMLLHSCVNTL